MVISILNPKGGSGKTTISLNLGLFLLSRNHKVVFHDLDPQKSLSDWLKRRPSSLKSTASYQHEAALMNETMVENRDHQDYLLDCPAGISGQGLDNVIKLSDAILIPVVPSPIDMDAMTHFYFQLAEIGVDGDKVAMIANRAKVYTRFHAKTINHIASYSIPLITTLRDTQNYTLTAANGMGIVDLPYSRAQKDITHWKDIIDWVESKRLPN